MICAELSRQSSWLRAMVVVQVRASPVCGVSTVELVTQLRAALAMVQAVQDNLLFCLAWT